MFQSIVTQPVFSQNITEQRGGVGRGAEMLVKEIIHLLAARKQGYGMGEGEMLRTRHHLPNTTLMTYLPCSDVPR